VEARRLEVEARRLEVEAGAPKWKPGAWKDKARRRVVKSRRLEVKSWRLEVEARRLEVEARRLESTGRRLAYVAGRDPDATRPTSSQPRRPAVSRGRLRLAPFPCSHLGTAPAFVSTGRAFTSAFVGGSSAASAVRACDKGPVAVVVPVVVPVPVARTRRLPISSTGRPGYAAEH
jgi:hypothetical protein